MTELNPNPTRAAGNDSPDDDPLSHLHKMSTTAGLGTAEYVAVNGMSVVAIIMGVASALSLLDPVLLVIPLLAVVLGIIAIWQVKESNGTQTGTGLAIGGLVFALLFCGLVGGRYAKEVIGNREDEQAINNLIVQLGQDLHAAKYDHAYQLFADKFTDRVKPQNFADTWKGFTQGSKDSPQLTGMRSNGRMEFDVDPNTGVRRGVGMTIMDFDKNAARIPFVFIKTEDGTWKIIDIPDLFKPQQAPPGPPRAR